MSVTSREQKQQWQEDRDVRRSFATGMQGELKNGSLAELKLSMIPAGTRLKIYYVAKDRKVNGRKEKFYEIFRMEFPTT